jgi:hypothetical protein
MTINDIIEAVRTDLAASLPQLLEAAGRPDFSRYTVGFPDNQDDTFCCVLFASVQSGSAGNFEFVIHLALPGLSETAAYDYLEAVREYLGANGGFNTEPLGYDTRTWESRVFDTEFTNGDIQALFSVTMSRQADDCG